MSDSHPVYPLLAERLTPDQLLELDKHLLDLTGVSLLLATVADLDHAWITAGLENAENAANPGGNSGA